MQTVLFTYPMINDGSKNMTMTVSNTTYSVSERERET